VLGQLADGKTRCNDGPLIEAIARLRGDSCQRLVQPNVRPELQWDLDVTENVILYNNKLLVVMDRNGGRITHVFAIHDGRPVVISGNLKAYQFLGDERKYRGQLPSDGAVLQNTVFVPSHRYIASDVKQSQSTLGEKYNRKPRICVDTDHVHFETGPFGPEDWLYPDNFNCYDLESGDNHPVQWSFPGKAWDMANADPMNVGKFSQLLSAYRAFIMNLPGRHPLVEARMRSTQPEFSKTITLDGNSIHVAYAGTQQGHQVANEFSLDHLTMLTHGVRQTRKIVAKERQIAVLRTDLAPPLTVTITLGGECRFSDATLREKPLDRSLHRAFSDCIEIESTDDGDFDYLIAVDRDPGRV
jgi:hypothetical protein